MPNDSKGPQTSEFEKITPAKIEISTRTSPSSAEIAEPAASPHAKQYLLGIGLALLVILGVAVFWILPQVVDKPQLVTEAPTERSIAPAPVSSVSPWQDAQLSRERKEAQDVLAEFLDQQFALEEKRVDLWGADEFTAAKEAAQEGDAAYREAAFGQAKQHYETGREMLAALLERSEHVVGDSLAAGASALEAGDAATARTAFELVLEVEPLNDVATRGLTRANSLDQVLEIYGKALAAEGGNSLDEARELLDQALRLDPEFQPAQRSRPQVLAKIAERDFAAAMSRGFAALDEARYKDANTAFDQALKLKPGSTEARDGLSQVSHELTQNKISGLKSTAVALEGKEQWQAARDKYLEVLALDASVVFAQEGIARTGTRARLNQLLTETLAQPARLSEAEVYQEARQLLKVAATVAEPGPVLSGQMANLRELLDIASRPVSITLNSDNLTDVTLYRVGHLGNFLTHELSLKPGIYALVGKRTGYRDVRKEFTVSHGKSHNPVAIQCTEKI